MSALNALSVALLLGGAFFFFAGTIGVLRFPDTLSRLHALTKADNIGLGLVAAALVVQAPTIAVAMKIAAIWVLVLLASSSACYLIARHAHLSRDRSRDSA